MVRRAARRIKSWHWRCVAAAAGGTPSPATRPVPLSLGYHGGGPLMGMTQPPPAPHDRPATLKRAAAPARGTRRYEDAAAHMDAATIAAALPPQPPGPFPPMLKPPITRGWGWLASPPLLVLARTCPVLMMQWGVGERRGRWRGGELAKVPCRHVEGRGSAACNDGSSEVELRRISRCRCVQWHLRRVVWRQ